MRYLAIVSETMRIVAETLDGFYEIPKKSERGTQTMDFESFAKSDPSALGIKLKPR